MLGRGGGEGKVRGRLVDLGGAEAGAYTRSHFRST